MFNKLTMFANNWILNSLFLICSILLSLYAKSICILMSFPDWGEGEGLRMGAGKYV